MAETKDGATWDVVSRCFPVSQPAITDGLDVCLCMAIYSGVHASGTKGPSL